MRTPTPQFRMADRLAGGTLSDELLAHRASGMSLDAICRQLYADHGIEVTRQTIGKWLEIAEPSEAAS